ncbi:MAG: hypothetical protein GX558_05195 [Clostridiales bacterium]|nr:hypothetical protein [Clostridiales bacterium]
MIRIFALALVCALLLMPCAALATEAEDPDLGEWSDEWQDEMVLVAQLPSDAVYLGAEEADGGYTQRLSTQDGLAAMVLVRRAGAVAAADLLKELYPDAQNVAEAGQDPVVAYPAARLTFALGQNQDSRAGVLVAFSTDADTFAMGVDVAADAWTGDDDYQTMAEMWFQSMDLFGGLSPDEAVQLWSQSEGDEFFFEEPEGLTLTAQLPDDTETDGAAVMDNGDYTQAYFVDNALAIVTVARRAADATAQDLLDELYPEAENVIQVEQAPIAAYPATRIAFTQGDATIGVKGVLVHIPTDAGAFAFAVDVDARSYDDYQDAIEQWIASIDFIDANEG